MASRRTSALLGLLAAASTPLAAAQTAPSVVDTRSPTPSAPGDGWGAIRGVCGLGDGRLDRAAEALAGAHLRGAAADGRTATYALRDAGDPHVWPRTAVLAGATLDGPTAVAALTPWLQGLAQGADTVRRCGVGGVRAADGVLHLAVVVVDAAGELAPVPRTGRTGQWITVEAQVPPSTTGGKVVVVGPDGAPRGVPTSASGGAIKARFPLDRPGAFLVQVLATGEEGPRPILEAPIFADVPPQPAAATMGGAAPGEDVTIPAETPPARALAAMVGGARASLRDSNVAPLRWDPALAAVAEAHVKAMVAQGKLAHDVGEGDPAERLRAAGVPFRDAGENVVRLAAAAGTPRERVALAHRRLWESPSHRGNVVSGRYTRVGVAIALAEDGALYGAEVFASEP